MNLDSIHTQLIRSSHSGRMFSDLVIGSLVRRREREREKKEIEANHHWEELN